MSELCTVSLMLSLRLLHMKTAKAQWQLRLKQQCLLIKCYTYGPEAVGRIYGIRPVYAKPRFHSALLRGP